YDLENKDILNIIHFLKLSGLNVTVITMDIRNIELRLVSDKWKALTNEILQLKYENKSQFLSENNITHINWNLEEEPFYMIIKKLERIWRQRR
ncbi:MAG: hypothetical protein ACOCV8_05450, partial [Spirochaetota bacterium]